MDDNTPKTKTEKLVAMGIKEDDHDFFTDKSIEIIWDKLKHTSNIINTKSDRLLYFINEISTQLNHDLVDDIDKFKIGRHELVTLDTDKFLENNKDKMKLYGISLNNDLQYAQRDKIKIYALSILRGLCDFYDYELQYRIITTIIDEEKKGVRYYVIKEKNN
jgi:hypothetical protein